MSTQEFLKERLGEPYTPLPLIVGHVYSAKKPRTAGVFDNRLNDRQILWMDLLGDQVQYDSPTVRNGSHYPKVTAEQFRKWAEADVTDQCPKDEWRTA